MAIRIPIVTEFNGKGIQKAVKEFKQLETVGQKAQFALKKAAVPAAAAFTAVAAGLFDATKAAIQDASAQKSLARQLQRSTKATDAQIEANEEWIATQGQLLGVTDDELRPALAGLARVTGSITKAQKAASLAMDISAAKGVSLETVTKTLERAYGGNLTAIGRLVPELKGMIKEGATLEQVMAKLSEKFGGDASEAANTTAGKFQRLKTSMDETKESIGESFLPVIEEVLPKLQDFSDWAADNPDLFKNIALGIGGITAATMALNAVMAVNPYVAMATGIGLVAGATNNLWKAASKLNGLKGAAAKLLIGILSPTVLSTITGDIVGGIAGRIRGNTSIAPKSFREAEGFNPGPMPATPTAAPDIATSRGASRTVIVNTGIGDPVAIGRSVAAVLDSYERRAS